MKTKIISLLFSSIFLLSCTPKFMATPVITKEPVSVSPTEEQPTVAVPTLTNGNALGTIPSCPKSGTPVPPPANFGIPGTIIYQKRYHGLYTVGGNPLSFSKLPVAEEQEYSTFGFSPDGKWFAFSPIEYSPVNEIIFDAAKIVLFSSNGERIETTLSIEDFVDEPPVEFRLVGFSGYSHWINNATIYGALYSTTGTSTSAGTIDDLPKVLDPFAGVWREDLLMDLPEGTKSLAKGISPDLTRMLYEGVEGVALKDLGNRIDLWHDKALFAGFGALMFWSPDSRMVAYANLYFSPEAPTVVLISRDGIAEPILGSTLPSELLVEDLRWSPDGHYLAILAWEGKGKGDVVLIYDIEAEKYVSRCPIGESADMSPHIIWSPDNKYIAYVSLDYPLIIMDVQSGETIKLVDNARAVGWSDEFPVVWP